MAKVPNKAHNFRVEYHPEFLYFNTYVREKGWTPDKHPHIWFGESDLSLYETCNMMLFDLAPASKKARSWPSVVINCLEASRFPPDVLDMVDMQAWLDYARSLNIEGMLHSYLPKIFKALDKTYEIPVIKVSPVRLTPCAPNHFRTIASGNYDDYHVTRGDPAHYDFARHIIYFPVPETASSPQIPEHRFEMVLMHEIVHASIRPFYGGSFQVGGFSFEIPLRTCNRAFSEVFAELGAAHAVYDLKGDFPSWKKLSSIANHLNYNQLFLEAYTSMVRIGFNKICQIVSPALRLCSRLVYLSREANKIETLTEKQMRGILTKKYAYKKKVSGMSKKALKKQLVKHERQRLLSFIDEMMNLQIHQLFAGAAAGNKGFTKKEKELLSKLSELFDPQMEAEWGASGIITV